MQPFELTVEDAAAAIAARALSPVELVDSVLDRCDAVEDRLHAYVTVVADRARRAARQAERRSARASTAGRSTAFRMASRT